MAKRNQDSIKGVASGRQTSQSPQVTPAVPAQPRGTAHRGSHPRCPASSTGQVISTTSVSPGWWLHCHIWLFGTWRGYVPVPAPHPHPLPPRLRQKARPCWLHAAVSSDTLMTWATGPPAWTSQSGCLLMQRSTKRLWTREKVVQARKGWSREGSPGDRAHTKVWVHRSQRATWGRYTKGQATARGVRDSRGTRLPCLPGTRAGGGQGHSSAGKQARAAVETSARGREKEISVLEKGLQVDVLAQT